MERRLRTAPHCRSSTAPPEGNREAAPACAVRASARLPGWRAGQGGRAGGLTQRGRGRLEEQQLAANVAHDEEGGLQGGAHRALHALRARKRLRQRVQQRVHQVPAGGERVRRGGAGQGRAAWEGQRGPDSASKAEQGGSLAQLAPKAQQCGWLGWVGGRWWVARAAWLPACPPARLHAQARPPTAHWFSKQNIWCVNSVDSLF